MITESLTYLKSFGIGLSFGGLPKTFAENFRAMQDRSGKTGRAIAQATGITESEISEYRTGSGGTPEAARLLKLATALRCTVDELLDGIDPDYDSVRELVCHDRDQHSGPSSHVGDLTNDTTPARILQLESENRELRSALEEVTNVAGKLVQIAKAGVEVHSAADVRSGGRDRD